VWRDPIWSLLGEELSPQRSGITDYEIFEEDPRGKQTFCSTGYNGKSWQECPDPRRVCTECGVCSVRCRKSAVHAGQISIQQKSLILTWSCNLSPSGSARHPVLCISKWKWGCFRLGMKYPRLERPKAPLHQERKQGKGAPQDA